MSEMQFPPTGPAQPPPPERPKKKHRFAKFVGIPAAVVLAIVVIASTASGEEATLPATGDPGHSQSQPAPEKERAPAPEQEKKAELSVAQRSAVDSASMYLETVGGFSRSGLIDQLKFEGFSVRDATFAVDHLDIDWNAQAVQSAKTYMETVGGFSRQGLVQQLRFEGFTPAQAQHGVNQAYR